jgi:hypothetical protein
MDYLLTSIFGKKALRQLSSSEYAEWAGEMLVHGYDSHSLCILAGLDRFASAFEAEAYFLRSLNELNLAPPDPDTALRAYACEIARRIIDGKITGQEGVRTLYKMCIATKYARDFVIWLELDEALDSLLYGQYPFTYESATLGNFDEIAKREAADFITTVCPQTAT